MSRILYGLVSIFLISASFSLFAAQSTQRNTHYGVASSLGDGTIRAYYKESRSGRPMALGIEISSLAFQNMPTSTSDGSWDVLDLGGNIVSYCCGHEFLLDLPRLAHHTPFKQVVVNFNPYGHNPPGVYDSTHFDFHFYLIDDAERRSIAAPLAEEQCQISGPDGMQQSVPLTCANYKKAVAPIPADTQAAGYVSVGAVEPGMGNHLLDLSSPEFNGDVFTRTWIYGTWDGQLHFFEPMITTDFLLGVRGKECVRYPIPDAMPKRGWYPTQYCMQYRPSLDSYQISLQRWVWFRRSSGG